MSKFFVPKGNVGDSKITIEGEDVLHIRRVLRMKPGDRLRLCDSAGFDYTAVIEEIGEKITCRIEDKEKSQTEPPVKVTLFQGIPKAAKMDYIIQKTVELGIYEIVPCMLNRCVSKIEGDRKITRWQKIAEEAAKQSGRGIIPKVHAPVALSDAAEMMKKCDIVFVPYECEEQNSLKTALTQKENVRTAAFMVGPEGGFDQAEIAELSQKGIMPVSLGKRILRTETAGEAVLAMLMYEIGDINLL